MVHTDTRCTSQLGRYRNKQVTMLGLFCNVTVTVDRAYLNHRTSQPSRMKFLFAKLFLLLRFTTGCGHTHLAYRLIEWKFA